MPVCHTLAGLSPVGTCVLGMLGNVVLAGMSVLGFLGNEVLAACLHWECWEMRCGEEVESKVGPAQEESLVYQGIRLQ